MSASQRVRELAAVTGVLVEDKVSCASDSSTCPVLDFASSGAMWITGLIDGPPVGITAPLLENVRALCDGISDLSAMMGTRVDLDASQVLTQRAAERGFYRRGQTSANGSCRIFRCTDAWIACNLPRPADVELLPAVVRQDVTENPWDVLQRFSSQSSAVEVVERAQELGLAFAALDERGTSSPSDGRAIDFVRIGDASDCRPDRVARVLDFSAMWAGPLCSHVLGLCNSKVLKVEDPERPDGARVGDRLMYRRLHDGHSLASVSFSTREGRREIHRLIESADVVVESSRPRALAQIGLSPEEFVTDKPGRSWISITGYGRNSERSNYVAFGDDAATAAGLVAWSNPDTPVFCADALADPISGLFGALGGLVAMAAGGGFLVDVSMIAAGAHVGQGQHCEGTHHVEQNSEGHWVASHDDLTQRVVLPTELAGMTSA